MTHNLRFCIFAFLAIITPSFGGVNKSYGNCTTNGTDFSYAPDYIGSVYCSRLTAEDYARANWWPVTDVAPTNVPTNMVAHAYGWRKDSHDNTRDEIEWVHNLPPDTNEMGEVIWFPVTNTVHYTTYTITRLYNVVLKPIPEPIPRKFSKLKIYCGLATMGEWDKIEAWLKTKDFNGVNGLKAFDLAQEVSEDHALFKPLATEARTLLGWDEAKMNGFLDTCILGE